MVETNHINNNDSDYTANTNTNIRRIQWTLIH